MSATEAADNLDERLNKALYESFKRYYQQSWPTRPLPESDQFRSAMSSIRDSGNSHILPVVDRFSQSMSKDNQKYYRAAALIQDSRMKSIAIRINEDYRHLTRSADKFATRMSFARILSIIGIFGVVVIGYYAADGSDARLLQSRTCRPLRRDLHHDVCGPGLTATPICVTVVSEERQRTIVSKLWPHSFVSDISFLRLARI